MNLRRLILTGLSLVLTTALLVYWIRSYRMDEAINYRTKSLVRYSLCPFDGAVFLEINNENSGMFGKSSGYGTGFWSYSFPPREFIPRSGPLEFMTGVQFNRAGFTYARGEKVLSIPINDPLVMGACDEFPTTIVACPFWLLILLANVPLLIVGWRALRRRRRMAKGSCFKCGYDLRAHQTGEKCPECGTAVVAAKAG